MVYPFRTTGPLFLALIFSLVLGVTVTITVVVCLLLLAALGKRLDARSGSLMGVFKT